MSLLEMYYYVFYKFYNFFKKLFPNRPGNKFRAIMLMVILELWLWFGVLNYWDVVIQQQTEADLLSFKMLIPILAILLLKWFLFIKDDRWRGYEQKFDHWLKKKNEKGAWIVIGITVFIVISSIISTYVRSGIR